MQWRGCENTVKIIRNVVSLLLISRTSKLSYVRYFTAVLQSAIKDIFKSKAVKVQSTLLKST